VLAAASAQQGLFARIWSGPCFDLDAPYRRRRRDRAISRVSEVGPQSCRLGGERRFKDTVRGE
jgi:hypothetical protein